MSDSILNGGCTCSTGGAPCSYCTDTYECEACGVRVEIAEEEERAVAECICTECLHEREDNTGYEPEPEDIMAAVRAFSGGR